MAGLGEGDGGGQPGDPGPDDEHFPIMAHRPTVRQGPAGLIQLLSVI
jgi:hypothetical protein